MTCPACAQVLNLNASEIALKGVVLTSCPTCGAVYRVRIEEVGAPHVPKHLLAKVANRAR